MRAGASSVTKRATSGSTMPAPAAMVSAACSSGLSSGADGSGDSGLRPIARSAFAERRRGEHGHVHGRELQRREEAGEPGADDHHVAVGAELLVGRRGEAWRVACAPFEAMAVLTSAAADPEGSAGGFSSSG